MKQTQPASMKLKKFLIGFLVLALLIPAAGFYYGLQQLKDYSIEVNHRLQDADASGKQIEQLQVLKGQVSQSQQLITKANSLFATSDSYQSQVLTDIKNHATAAGIAVVSTEFDSSTTVGNQRVVTVKLADSITYTQLVSFFNGIESNLPKMQVASVTLGHKTGGKDSVSVSDIKITVSVR